MSLTYRESVEESTIFKIVWNLFSNLLPNFVYISGGYLTVCLIIDSRCVLPIILFVAGVILEMVLTLIYKRVYFYYTGFISLMLLGIGTVILRQGDLDEFVYLFILFFTFTLVNGLVWGHMNKVKGLGKGVGYIFLLIIRIIFLFFTYIYIKQTFEVDSSLMWNLSDDFLFTVNDLYLIISLSSIYLISIFNTFQLLVVHDLMHSILNQLYKISSWSMDSNVLQSKLLQGSHPLQLNERTVVIGDIRGFTAFTENNSIDRVIELLKRFYHVVEKIVEEHGGFKPEFIGDQFITFFEKSEDAVMFSFHITKELVNLMSDYGVSIGIGIEKGSILEGVIGGDHSKKYTLIGRPINIASRLQSKAKAGEILVSKRIAESVPNLTVKRRNDIKLKGINHGFECCQLCEYKAPKKANFSSKFNEILDNFFSFLSIK